MMLTCTNKIFCVVKTCSNLFSADTTGTPNMGLPYYALMTYTFTCKPTYFLTALNQVSDVYTCQAAGTWNKALTSCTGILQGWKRAWIIIMRNYLATCTPITSLTNGVVTGGTDYTNILDRPVSAATATFTCNPGYTLSGATTATCSATGTWSAAVPTCTRKRHRRYFVGESLTLSLITIKHSENLHKHFCRRHHWQRESALTV